MIVKISRLWNILSLTFKSRLYDLKFTNKEVVSDQGTFPLVRVHLDTYMYARVQNLPLDAW